MGVCENEHLMKCIDVYECIKLKIKLIIMEYCDYGSLDQLIQVRIRLTEIEAKMIIKQIIYALGDFHRHGLIHRDVKSENICFRKNL